MKKTFVMFMMFMMLIMFNACGNKSVLTDNEIQNNLSKLGFNVNDITSSMEDSNIVKVKTANNRKYQIEYYVFKSIDTAKKAYKNNTNMFKQNKKYKSKESSGDNYDEYYQQTNDLYNKVVRVDKTLVYVSVNLDYKKDVNKVLKKIGF